jgi:hypothetical protein
VNVLHYDVDLAGGMQTQHKKSDLVSGNPVQLALLGDMFTVYWWSFGVKHLNGVFPYEFFAQIGFFAGIGF